ncbi:TIGR04222 domain-containing membrane protein [Sphaerisporangium sp. TRM90804]|uniref:TIGR04222 domain-containing membrane protein n=1 Tax=Sphaerisporangium sp. TRM90804 TaxID=3031113 RepID=UPI00244A75C8|nr:TIGR04222 domain-containing membrane protein [Sphaerisporangium sp. TRM90804]MDH2428377.1 TIGR04222 domain-containing membrane protein [Sphaerisporangium sp. TRM90804]
MDTRTELDLYETAYLCGGARRVAMVAVVALCDDGRAEIHPEAHRVTIVHREAGDPVEAAVLAAVPEAGRHFGNAVTAVADSPAVEAIAESLRDLGLVTRRRRTASLRGRQTLRALAAEARDTGSPRDVAFAGVAGIADQRLRNTFALQERTETGRSPSRRWRSSLGPLGPMSPPTGTGISHGPAHGGWDGGGSCDGGGGGGGGGGC